MSRRMTRIRLPGRPHGDGFMIDELQTVEHMVAIMRRQSEHHRQIADAIDAAADEDFQIDYVLGTGVQHVLRNLQPGREDVK